MVCNATCFPGYFGYLCKDECDCPVDQCDRKYGCRRNAPGRSLRKNMGNIFLNTTFFPIKYYFFLNSCDSSIALVRNEYTCIYIKICTLNQFGYLDKNLIRSEHYNIFLSNKVLSYIFPRLHFSRSIELFAEFLNSHHVGKMRSGSCLACAARRSATFDTSGYR